LVAGLPNLQTSFYQSNPEYDFIVKVDSCFDRTFIAFPACALSYTWYFGDGDSSHLRDVSHTYLENGVYTVTLIADSQEITKEIRIGLLDDDVKISGTTILCDLPVALDYHAKFDENRTYHWQVANGYAVPSGSQVNILWDTGIDVSRSINLVVEDNFTGCIDTGFLPVRIHNPDSLPFHLKVENCLEVTFTSEVICGMVPRWDVGDGSKYMGAVVTHTYDTAGIYTVFMYIGEDSLEHTFEIGYGGRLKIIGDYSSCGDTANYIHILEETRDSIWINVSNAHSWSFNNDTLSSWWHQSGTIQVVSQDLSGCSDSASIDITHTVPVLFDFAFNVKNCHTVEFKSMGYCDSTYHWDFGDGNFSSVMNPIHIYNDTGTYLVRFIVQSDTVKKWIKIGIDFSNHAISGPDMGCVSSDVAYSVSPWQFGFDYHWSAENGSISAQTGHKARIRWNNAGVLTVVVKDQVTACSDTLTRQVMVYPALNNTVTGPEYQEQCEASNIVALGQIFQPVSGGSGVYLYQWYLDTLNSSKIDTALMQKINGEATATYTPTSSGRYFRTVTSGSCFYLPYQANVVALPKPNNLYFNPEIVNPCYEGHPITIPASNNLMKPTDYSNEWVESYIWEQSKDSVNWTVLSDNEKHLNTFTDSITNYYRRTVVLEYPFAHSFSIPTCSIPSNQVAVITPKYHFTALEDVNFCENGDQYIKVNVISEPEIESILHSYKRVSNNTKMWTNLGNSVNHQLFFAENNNIKIEHNDSLRLEYKPPGCQAYWSNKALFKSVSEGNSIISDKMNQTLEYGDTLTLTILNKSIDHSEWQYRFNGSSQWQEIEYSNTDSALYINRTNCYDTVFLRNGYCNNPGDDLYNVISQYLYGDIWMRDSWKDVGLEPNPDSAHYDIVLSPDIWNRQQNDSIFEHENPEHSIYDPNFLYVKVRNRGNENTIPTPLYLYWTFASINGEAWDLAWLDIPENQFQHYYSNGNPIPNWTFPLGSRINDTPIMVPSIAPGDSMIIAHSWFPPSPDWYYKRGSNKEKVGSYGDKINVCVLARLEECEVYPHRMAFDEIFDDHVKYNAINNNNIITRNLWVEDQLGDPILIPKGGGGYGIGFKLPPISCGGLIPDTETPPNEIPDSPVTFRPCLEGVTSGFFDMWEVYFEPDEILKNAILSANPPISEVIYIGDNIFKFTDSNLCIPNIVIEDNQTVFMELIYAPRNGWSNILTQKYTFGIAQYLGESVNSVGACYFTIDNTSDIFQSMIEYDNYSPPSEYNSQSMIVAPNPTTGVFDLYLDEDTKQQLEGQFGDIIVADGYGIPLREINNVPANATTQISLYGERAGLFSVRFIIGNHVFYKYVIKTDQ
jgi:hypothetical protein